MVSRRFHPRRYQLNKEGAAVVRAGHPWLYRNRLSSAAAVFADGQFLELVDGSNRTLGFGVYHQEGLIGVRVFGGTGPLGSAGLDARLEQALARRTHLRNYTNAFRALHGDNDGFPGVVLDCYGPHGVLQTYATAVDPLGRYLGAKLTRKLGLESLVWHPPARRRSGAKEPKSQRLLRGVAPGRIEVREGKLKYFVDLAAGQKSGAFLDLRGLRKWISLQKWNGFRVLNLFSYSGTLGLAAEFAGAKEVVNVDVSEGALAFAKAHNQGGRGVQRYLPMDIFERLGEGPPGGGRYDVIIVDPPSMASEMSQVPKALAAYRRMYTQVLGYLGPRGQIIGGCCTSRITRADFRRTLERALGPGLKLRHAIAPEDDHPVAFAEGDYLKLFVFAP